MVTGCYRKSITSTPLCFDLSKVNIVALTGTLGFKLRTDIPIGSDSFRMVKLAFTGNLVVGSKSNCIEENSESEDFGVKRTTSKFLPAWSCVPR